MRYATSKCKYNQKKSEENPFLPLIDRLKTLEEKFLLSLFMYGNFESSSLQTMIFLKENSALEYFGDNTLA